MRAKDVMSKPVVTVTPDTTLKRAAELFLENDIGAVPVVDAAGAIIGIVSEADLISLEAEPKTEFHFLRRRAAVDSIPKTAGEAMTRNVVAMDQDADVSHLARVMIERKLRHVPIVRGKHAVGIVSRRDLIKALARSDLEIQVELEELLDDEILMVGAFRAEVENGMVTLRGPRDRASRQLAKVLAKSVPGVIAVRFAEPTEATADAS